LGVFIFIGGASVVCAEDQSNAISYSDIVLGGRALLSLKDGTKLEGKITFLKPEGLVIEGENSWRVVKQEEISEILQVSKADPAAPASSSNAPGDTLVVHGPQSWVEHSDQGKPRSEKLTDIEKDIATEGDHQWEGLITMGLGIAAEVLAPTLVSKIQDSPTTYHYDYTTSYIAGSAGAIVVVVGFWDWYWSTNKKQLLETKRYDFALRPDLRLACGPSFGLNIGWRF
jgi:hypothetical protein